MAAITDYLFSKEFTFYRNVLTVFGGVFVLKLLKKTIWSLVGGFCAYCLAPFGISRINLKKYGSWAIITGASEGIGKAYALELAKNGLNIVILSRSEEKLEKVAVEIRERFGREVRCVAVDFSEGQAVYDDIQAEISDIDVAILVNNVAVINECPSLTAEVDEMRHRSIIEVNCQAMVQMCHLVLPKMIENERGIIVNISSVTSMLTFPMLNVYNATKKFIVYFSNGLRFEYKSKGIIVQTVMPATVATISSGMNPGLFAPTPETFARSAVATIGLRNETFGYLPHAFVGSFLSSLPASLSVRMAYSAMLAVRDQKLKDQKLKDKARQTKKE